MRRFDITNKVNGMKFTVERDTLEPMQPEWGKPERWSFDAPEDGIILDSREVEVSPAVPSVETIDPDTGEVQMSLPVDAVFQTEYLLPAEYEITITDVSEEIEAQAESREALAYLKRTDWYAIRYADTGEAIPDDVKKRRAAARERVVKV